ncbi:hypothetical protein GCM10009641_46900 [Mycobacterium cookii]|jgi:hypothetical protein|uniref:Secreted protein n=1 Tax=Nocardioides furvisabuli TaxID=375542 RepID=A0ABN2XRB3_9ACTN|nr:HAD domain-containing protein [Nocardioides furvisabuli]
MNHRVYRKPAIIPVPSEGPPQIRWFLDIDGTISPYGLSLPWDDATLYGPRPNSDLAVPYRREVADGIQRISQREGVEVVWLTTWSHDEVKAWTEAGLGPFRLIRKRKAGRDRWWKAQAVKEWLHKHPHGRAIWTDDDISTGGLRGLDRTRLLAIAPDPAVGLRTRDLAKIERWIAALGSRPTG